MKTKLFILIAINILSLVALAQGDDLAGTIPACKNSAIGLEKWSTVRLYTGDGQLMPVYFNYRRRKLMCNGERMSGIELVNICRNIPDSLIQEQIQCYDRLSSNKRWILNSTVICGVNVFAMGAAASSTAQDNSTFFGACAFASAVAAGVTAICSSIPHQKRKVIMFRDLPVAYNRYAEIRNQQLNNYNSQN